MKKAVLILSAAILVLALFTGCATEAKPKEYDLDAVALAVEETGSFTDLLNAVNLSTAAKLYKIDETLVDQCVVKCSTGATTEEIGLFKCVSEEAAKTVETAAHERAEAQKTAYESYAPGEVPKLDDAIIRSDGVYVFYIVSDDAASVDAALKKF